jgi:Flp pilus assembly pilin Flp
VEVFLMKRLFKQIGQGMTEYIIIVALIAIAAIAAYGLFGDTIRGQVGGMAAELGGGDGTAAITKAGTAGADAAGRGAAAGKTLADYNQ